MIKGLLALDENLASSIALRYAARLVEMLPLQLEAGHVETPAGRQNYSPGGGWARHTWEKGLREAGLEAIERLLNTEKVPCPFGGAPKIFVGDRDEKLLEELRSGDYDLFVEGNLNNSSAAEFFTLLSSRLYAKTPCPIMIVKDLVEGRRAALLYSESMDLMNFMLRALRILAGGGFTLDLLLFRSADNEEPVFLDKKEAALALHEAEELLAANDLQAENAQVVFGTPAGVAGLLSRYSVVASAFPTNKSPRLELLALCPSPVLLCR